MNYSVKRFSLQLITAGPKSVIILLGVLLCYGLKAQPLEINLWPDGAPLNEELKQAQINLNSKYSTDNLEAKVFFYLPKSEKPTAAVLICPGGGYGGLAMNHEGHQVAQWLNEKGIAGVVLKYRLPHGIHQIPITDAQQALRLIRRNADKWNIDPTKVGVAGFSAGGHLASTVDAHFTDSITRPDFAVLFYPVISSDPAIWHGGSFRNLLGKDPDETLLKKYSNEFLVTEQTPPTLIFHSDDDKGVLVENSIEFYGALKANKVPSALYIFPVGGHGWGMNPAFVYHQQWKDLMLMWLKEIKVIQ